MLFVEKFEGIAMVGFPMTLCNCQKQRNEAILKAAAVYNVLL